MPDKAILCYICILEIILIDKTDQNNRIIQLMGQFTPDDILSMIKIWDNDPLKSQILFITASLLRAIRLVAELSVSNFQSMYNVFDYYPIMPPYFTLLPLNYKNKSNIISFYILYEFADKKTSFYYSFLNKRVYFWNNIHS